MSQRFVIPVEDNSRTNLFSIDAFIRQLADAPQRKVLLGRIRSGEVDPLNYEREHKLPHGALDMILLIEDPRFAEVQTRWVKKIQDLKEQGGVLPSNEELRNQLQADLAPVEADYPGTQAFVQSYGKLLAKARERQRKLPGGYEEIVPVQMVFSVFAGVVAVAVFAVAVTFIFAAANGTATANGIANANMAYNTNYVFDDSSTARASGFGT